AELLESESQALLRLEPSASGHLTPMKHGACPLEERDDSNPAHEIAEPVPNEHQGDLVQARQIPHHAHRRLTHGWPYFVFLDSACWRKASAKPASSPLVNSDMFAPYSRNVSKPGTVRARYEALMRLANSLIICAMRTLASAPTRCACSPRSTR